MKPGHETTERGAGERGGQAMEQDQANGSFAALLRGRRLAAGLTQEALAERARLGVRSIQGLERGAHRPLRDTARRLAAALGLEAEERARFLAASGPLPRTPRDWDVFVPAASPPSSAGAPSPPSPCHNLPLELTRFVGRARELTEVAALLGQGRLLTLTGTGGVGKTRLALQVAARLVEDYPDGVWLVELAALADPAQLPQTVAAALGVREQPGRPPEETLLAALRPRRLLLLLDNCEHLRDACARLAERLLRACADLRILATSREPLGLAGETARRVPSLALPDPHRLPALETLAQVEAVQLFVERAQAAHPPFALAAANATLVAAICARLDGIPLALELAAAQVRALSVEHLAARMDRQFQVLTGGSRTALPHQQTLRATVDWSYALLSDGAQRLFVRLAVFVGSFTLEATEAVGAGGSIAAEDVLGLLVRLVDASLALVVAAGAEDDGAEARYRLLEPLRQYAEERLRADEGEAAGVRGRHAAYYMALAEEAEPHLRGPEQLAWQDRQQADRDNLRAALRWFVERGAAEEALRLAVVLYWFWARREAGWAEYSAWLTQALALSEVTTPSQARARALCTAGLVAIVQGETAAAHRLLEEGVALGRQLDDHAAIAEALLWLGAHAMSRGEYREARPLLEESLALWRGLGDAFGVTEVLCNLSRLIICEGDHAGARALLDEARALARRQGERRHIGYVLEVRGEVAFAAGDLAEAGRLWVESLAHYTELGDPLGIISVAILEGRLALRMGDVTRARARYTASLEHQRRAGWQVAASALQALAGLATVAGAEGRADRALRLAGATLAGCVARGLRLPEPEQEALDRAIAPARATLDERTAAVALAEGAAMTLEEAIAEALQDTATHAG